MGRTIPLLLTSLLIATLMSGCTFSNGADGQTAGGPGTLSYNGASTGSHTSEPLSCDGSGKVNVNYNMGGGSIKVTVKDGAGATAFSKTYSGTGQQSETKNISGQSGQWTVTVTRESGSSYGGFTGQQYGGFSGQYNVNIAC